MAKTYNTISTFTAGNVLTAAEMNQIGENSNNYRIPPMCQVYRSSDLTGYTSASNITWNGEEFDTDGMFSAPSTDITIQTAGVYSIEFYTYWNATPTVTGVSAYISNGGASIASGFAAAPTSAAGIQTRNAVVALSASDVITFGIEFTGGSAFVVKGGSNPGNLVTRATLIWLGLDS